MTDAIKSNDIVNSYGDDGESIAQGDGKAIAHGKRGKAFADGNNGVAIAYGECGKAIAHGGLAIAYGRYGKVKGSKIGCELIVLNHETDKPVKVIVGENGIEANVWYGLKYGLVKV